MMALTNKIIHCGTDYNNENGLMNFQVKELIKKTRNKIIIIMLHEISFSDNIYYASLKDFRPDDSNLLKLSYKCDGRQWSDFFKKSFNPARFEFYHNGYLQCEFIPEPGADIIDMLTRYYDKLKHKIKFKEVEYQLLFNHRNNQKLKLIANLTSDIKPDEKIFDIYVKTANSLWNRHCATILENLIEIIKPKEDVIRGMIEMDISEIKIIDILCDFYYKNK